MDFEFVVRLVFRWLHILPAVILLGGVFFQRLALLPAMGEFEEAERARVQGALRRRWAKWVGILAGLLLLSGMVNTVLIIRQDKPVGMYHGLLLVKILLALGIIYIASLLGGRSEAAERFRQKAPFWANVNVVLSILLICVAGGMRLTERKAKPDVGSASTSVAPGSASPNMLGD